MPDPADAPTSRPDPTLKPPAEPAWRRGWLDWWLALPGNVRGAFWILAASILFSIMSAAVKTVGARLDIFQIAFFRCLVGLLVILPFMVRAGPHVFRTRRPVLHVVRSLTGLVAMFCGFYAITHLPLADATAITFAKPLFMIILAVLFLGEVVRWRRWSATIIGFLGVLIMINPGENGLDPAMAAALAGTLCVAVVVVLVKRLSATEAPLTILFTFGIVSTLASTVPAALVWQAPTWAEFGLMVLIGSLGASGQFCMIRGFRVGEATAVVPFEYSQLLFAGIFGYVLFGNIPTLNTLASAVLIVASTLYIALREAKLGKKPAAKASVQAPAPVAVDTGNGQPPSA
ncbi:DMT family transporter [Thalassobaculum litoreum]|uniref:Permease of the drug/metabolite transporter (DMT) superfamily n=1 Tax=Thalassobaculum litoreum DSM 18839 TaxID=1123362 RepID=A0A8G2BIM8_9PROT|nr:DMT family transporter [Thalassobaculum litoreum]SDF55357.1 Permease of the drug/metabolite transporter (DMT) superfamily [Thalassobaculum litoreum DSM 18839]